MTAPWLSGARKLICLWIHRLRCNVYDARRASSPGVSLFSALPILFLALTLPNQTHANGALNAYQVYDAQLCRATVEVIAFDLERLSEGTAPDAINRGLERRLRTFASPLVWLCRRAVTIAPSSVRSTLTALQAAIRRGDGRYLEDIFTETRSIRQSIIDAGQDTDSPNFGRDK